MHQTRCGAAARFESQRLDVVRIRRVSSPWTNVVPFVLVQRMGLLIEESRGEGRDICSARGHEALIHHSDECLVNTASHAMDPGRWKNGVPR